ncbi:MAG: hypothetical protein LBF05_06410, partial [Tannerella sp.]|nr:hypothetical protein [Tannerella sp.]
QIKTRRTKRKKLIIHKIKICVPLLTLRYLRANTLLRQPHTAHRQPLFSVDMFALTGNAQNYAACSIKACGKISGNSKIFLQTCGKISSIPESLLQTCGRLSSIPESLLQT